MTHTFAAFILGLIVMAYAASYAHEEYISSRVHLGQLVYDDAAYIILPAAPPVFYGMGGL